MRESEFIEKYCVGFNRQQIAAICAQDARILLLAVPGSGKTTVMAARAAYQILCKGADPAQMLTITFSRAATREMRERFAARFGAQCAGAPLFCTINSLANRIIDECCRMYGLAKPTLLESRREVLREAYARCFPDEGGPGEALEGALDRAAGYCKNMLFTREERLRYCPDEELTPRVFNAVFETMTGIMRERNLIDFDDQSLVALMLLEAYPELLKAFRARFRHISVDEAQDTSYAQHRLIWRLSETADSLFMVGDEDQSIYGFRGAYPGILLAFERVYPGAKILKLESNYRSTANIVRAAERFIRGGAQRTAKRMATPNPKGPRIRLKRPLHIKRQYPYIAKRVLRCQKEGKSVAVLYRNNVSAAALADYLTKCGVAFRCAGGVRKALGGRKVQDVLAILRCAQGPAAAEALFAACRALLLSVSFEQCQKAAELARRRGEAALFTLAFLLPEGRARVTAFARMKAAISKKPVRALMAAWALYAKDQAAEGAYSPSDREKLDMLCAIADASADIAEFLQRMDALCALDESWDGDPSEPPEGGFAVEGANTPEAAVPALLSTIHASKGLEFDTVVLVDANRGVFPASGDSMGVEDPVEAERRLFYVAVTRAKRELELISPRFGYCGRLAPSEFVREFMGRGRVWRAVLRWISRLQETRTPADLADAQVRGGDWAQNTLCVPQPHAAWDTVAAYACYDTWQEHPAVSPGAEVWHPRLGRGRILRREGRLAEIDFSGRLRRWDIEYCLDEGILRLSVPDEGIGAGANNTYGL